MFIFWPRLLYGFSLFVWPIFKLIQFFLASDLAAKLNLSIREHDCSHEAGSARHDENISNSIDKDKKQNSQKMSKNFSKRNSTSFTNLNNFFANNEPNFGRDKADLNSSLTNLRSSNSEFKFRPKSQITSLENESYDFEEQGDDCIYQISFKKVYNTQLTDSNNNQVNSGANSGLVYTRVKLKQLRYASLSKFIEHLVNSDTGEIDSNLVHTFLATYRTFSDTKTVLSMLREQYAKVMPASLEMTEDVRQQYLKSLRLLIKLWLKNYSEDFNEPTDYPNLNELYRFGQNYFADSGLIALIRSKFEQFKANDQSSDSLEGSSTSFGTLDQAQAGLNVDEDFLSVDSKYFAEQLTFLDKIYFQKLCAHHCLGSVWGTRYQKSSKMTLSNNSDNLLAMPLSDKFADSALSIKQFNLVTDYIQSSILQDVELKPAQRAKIVRKWIEIARHCRKLKNFNSLNAIVLSLNGPYVSRLEKCWAEVPAEEKREFDKLSEIFSQEKNQQMLRDILIKELNNYRFLIDSAEPLSKPTGLSKSSSFKDLLSLEGTSKYAEINLGINATLGRKMKENLLKQNKKIIKQTEPVGTIPFLGMFLRDLEYLNAQSKRMDKNMINVQQKRKEFEIIAQIKLLQQASHLYSIKADPSFDKWLHSHKLLDRNDFSNYSNQIEPANESTRNSRVKSNISYRSESNESLNQMSFNGLKTPGVKQKSIFKTKSNHSRCSSIGSSDLADSSESPKSILKNSMSNSSQNDSCNTSNSIECSPINNQYTVKVKIEQNEPAKRPDAEILYKKMSISNQDRTKEVKTRILNKFFMNPELYDEFVLVQVLDVPNEIPIGDNSNVYYALRNSEDMQLVLRKRTLSSTPSSNNSSNSYASHNRISSLPPQCPNKSTYKNNSPTIRKFLRKIL